MYVCGIRVYQKNGELIIKEDEAEVVRKIFYMYLQGNGLQTIANRLNAEGVPEDTAIRFGI